MASLYNSFSPNKVMVQITEFDDVVACKNVRVRKLMDAILDLFEGAVTHHYRYYPNLIGDESLLAAMALEAAKRQGQFRPLYDALITQKAINCESLLTLASRLNLDEDKFMHDLTSDQVHNVVKADWQAGFALRIQSTPTLYVNGYRFYGKPSLSRLLPFVRHCADRSSSALGYMGQFEQVSVRKQDILSQGSSFLL
ncbi:hypothetical protein GCM10028808_09190 [Spirosoma migulaei]